MRGLARTRLRPDEGFGLVEVMVATGVVFVALTMLAYSVTSTFGDVGLARQRQGANAVANRTIELARSLPYELFTRGGRTADLQADPLVADCGAELRFENCSGEIVVHTPGLPDTPPLAPHLTAQSLAASPTEYSVAAYVTEAVDAPTAGGFRLRVMVSWEVPLRTGATTDLEVETIVYQPSGCVDPATHPFAAPCEPFLYGTSASGTGTIGLGATINGVAVQATSDAPAARVDAQIEQVRHLQGAAGASALSLATVTSTQTTGHESVASGADDDAATPSILPYSSVPLVGGTDTLTETVGLIELSLQRSGVDNGASTSATAASPTQVCPTTTPPGPGQSDAEPCAHSWVQQGGDIQATLGFAAPLTLGDATLFSLGAPAQGTHATADRETAADDGRVITTVDRSLGELRIGGLPGGVAPPLGWQGYWLRVTPYEDSVTAESGDATEAPSVTVSSGSIEYWNGTGYTTHAITPGAPVDLPVATVDIDVSILTLQISLDISGTVRTGGTSTSDPEGPGSGVTRHAASATSSSPVVADFTYALTITDGLLIDEAVSADISIDLGTSRAGASYREGADG